MPPPSGPEKPPGASQSTRNRDPLQDLRGGLEGILSRLDPGKLETEDLLVLAVLWLLYRDSGDKELLIVFNIKQSRRDINRLKSGPVPFCYL